MPEAQHLNSASDFAHLDGTLVFPLYIGDLHALITQDGYALLLPKGMHVHEPGRIGIGDDGVPYVNTDITDPEELMTIIRWGQMLSSVPVIADIKAHLDAVLATTTDDERETFVNKPDCILGEEH